MNQGKLEVVKQEMARVNIDFLGISELKWTGMGEFNSDDNYIYYYGQEFLTSLTEDSNSVIEHSWLIISDSTSKPSHTVHTVHGVLKARILKWFAIPFSSGPHSFRPLHHDPPVLGGPTQHGLVSLS